MLAQQDRSAKLKKQLEEIEENKKAEATRIEAMKAELEQVCGAMHVVWRGVVRCRIHMNR